MIHQPDLLGRLAALDVPVRVVAAELDIRPDGPVRQPAGWLPRGSFARLPGVRHDFWHDRPDLWRRLVASLAG